MMNINFYVKSMGSFIILSVMWYEWLTKCYLLHTDPSEFRELGKTCQATCFPLSTLNHWSFTEHTSWPSKPWLPKFPRWDSWAWIMSQKMRWCAISLNHGLWRLLSKYGLFWALREVFPKSMIMLMWYGRQWNEAMWCEKFVLNTFFTTSFLS